MRRMYRRCKALPNRNKSKGGLTPMAATREHAIYIRPYTEVRDILMERARKARNPMDHAPFDEVREILDRLDTLDRDTWAAAFSAPAERHFAAALEAERAGKTEEARRGYVAAFGLFRAARYPAPNSPGKKAAYRRSQDAFFKAAALSGAPVERVEMPYVGAQAKGAAIIGYLHRPRRDGALPIVVQWGGIDSFKEDRRPEPYLAAGFAVLAMDMPGVGDAPIAGSETGEELWNGVFDWIAAQPTLDARRIVLVGASTGGYWATNRAHASRADCRRRHAWRARAFRVSARLDFASCTWRISFRARRDACLRLRPRDRGGMDRRRAAPVAARPGDSR